MCTVTWKLAARLKFRFDVCDRLLSIEDLDSAKPIENCDRKVLSVCVQLYRLLAAGRTPLADG